jgi:DNA-directed RNA polymerase specialized sigma24 family protein
MDTPESIEFFEAYLLKSVTREAIHRRKRYRRVVYVERKDLERLAGAVSTDVERRLDEAKLIEIFRACLDARGRAMFDMRVLHFDWRWIAKLTGYADARSAQTQFSKKCDRALERFQAHHGSRLKPQSSE